MSAVVIVEVVTELVATMLVVIELSTTVDEAIVEAVVVEDVGKARGNDGLEAVVRQRPGGVLAARPAAKIFERDHNIRLRVRLAVQHKRINLCTLNRKAHFVKQPILEAGALNRLQKLLGDNHIRVDILDRQWRGNGRKGSKFLHKVSPCGAL